MDTKISYDRLLFFHQYGLAEFFHKDLDCLSVSPTMAIKSKDLTYEAELPPFLQRLHDQQAGRDPDRHERQIARPTRSRLTDADDAPTIVADTGETVTTDELQNLLANQGPSASVGGTVTGDLEEAEPKASTARSKENDGGKKAESKQKVTDGTAVKKRKLAKVIHADGPSDGSEKHTAECGAEASNKKPVKQVKKRAKVKLAFDDDPAD